MRTKKAEAWLGAIFIIIIILLFLAWIVTYAQRECNSNEDCAKDSYCGSDFDCHRHPIIMQEKIISQNDYTGAAFILGLSLVVAALILRSRNANSNNAPPFSTALTRTHRPTQEEGDYGLKSAQHFEHYGEDAPAQGTRKHH